jgi:type I restriction enzyme M protein
MQTALPLSSTLTSAEKSKLWAAADALRGHLDAAEYKHTVLGLIFLKYISDAFDERHADLEAEQDQGADPEEKDEYAAAGVFWVPKEARWSYLAENAKQPGIGTLVDRRDDGDRTREPDPARRAAKGLCPSVAR